MRRQSIKRDNPPTIPPALESGATTLGDPHVLNDVLTRPVPQDVARDERAPEAPAAGSWTAPVLSASGDAGVDLRESIRAKLTFALGRTPETARPRDWFAATALALRERIVAAALAAERSVPNKRVYYLSLEFLIGRLMSDAMNNLGLTETTRAALRELGVDLDAVQEAEPDAALGNGGLGRLAACFMESMASIGIPAMGYGIRYDHGLFRQSFEDGWQREAPETWLAEGNPWEFARPEATYAIGFGGTVTMSSAEEGVIRRHWQPAETVRAVAHDVPVVGWRGRHVNALRLWKAEAGEPVDLARFNGGDHVGAVAARMRAEAISRVLYPSDSSAEGQELRLRQEYFFTAASIQDLVARHVAERGDVRSLPDHAAIQLNDTHPAIAVPELMRILIDAHGLSWEDAWHVTTHTLHYTNHTLLPEALETWPVELMERLLPRHMQIIYLINWMHLEEQAKHARQDTASDNAAYLASISLIDESHGRRVRMGHLAFHGARRVNGVSALHTDLMRSTVFSDLHALDTDKIVNKTNGITFRRWFHNANPGLTRLAVETVGAGVLDNPELLRGLEAHAEDPVFVARYAAVRRERKEALADLIAERTGIDVDPAALFDVQVKRIHEYKRQLLNILETVALYQAIKAEPHRDWTPRVKIFAGKAAPSYVQAKLIIKLACDVAKAVNDDPEVAGRLKVVFLPNYSVSLAEAIIPAADLSEQISTAGLEASGTGNMKFALNGALTVGTLDGANIEIRDHVGADNIFIFGLEADGVKARQAEPDYAAKAIQASPRLAAALDMIAAGRFSPEEPGRFRPLTDDLRRRDQYLLTADFDDYWRVQRAIDAAWRDPRGWWAKAIRNTARMAWFSSDRAMREYAEEIWRVRLG
ncbi:glycogen/starch/alpha-glucan phosphorylase [Methylobacterium sp. 092160098-2]|uniref:glycogen/starch/alpha-glucan phosphorylase n=2 Tax=Methylobacterium TaxID=407 RepID=UPI001EF08B16|nr:MULTISPECIES: glycogen/starch/alpha-glucan phosphorylase [Methylobacterium]MDE4913693.1 glycogen/starch/alpha-glucan phosphorylase [Methylobacterium sp. 092160098-2]MDH3027974.1 glycogen/starch/alpha-glucan phosphorylase [Methylobacterium fujisawaense]WFS09472.1 glycogen/starch/alpha-glucan phosphorylase [Methylobacterium sp. 391_Methyba4]